MANLLAGNLKDFLPFFNASFIGYFFSGHGTSESKVFQGYFRGISGVFKTYLFIS